MRAVRSHGRKRDAGLINDSFTGIGDSCIYCVQYALANQKDELKSLILFLFENFAIHSFKPSFTSDYQQPSELYDFVLDCFSNMKHRKYERTEVALDWSAPISLKVRFYQALKNCYVRVKMPLVFAPDLHMIDTNFVIEILYIKFRGASVFETLIQDWQAGDRNIKQISAVNITKDVRWGPLIDEMDNFLKAIPTHIVEICTNNTVKVQLKRNMDQKTLCVEYCIIDEESQFKQELRMREM